jgi:hypothetical protein
MLDDTLSMMYYILLRNQFRGLNARNQRKQLCYESFSLITFSLFLFIEFVSK